MAQHCAPRYVRTKQVTRQLVDRAPVVAGATVVGLGVLAVPAQAGEHLTSGGDRSTAAVVEPPPPSAPAAHEVAQAAGAGPTSRDTYTVVVGDTLAEIATVHDEPWRVLFERNVAVIGNDPNRILPGQVLALHGVVEAAAPAAASTAAPEVAEVGVSTIVPTGAAVISNSAGAVVPAVQAAADAVVSDVRGAALITIGGTRASATDPNGHPAGLALDYMVLSDAALGDAIVQYHLDHWAQLGVEYLIWQQRILLSPTGSWQAMEDRGSATANHMDHVHVNYVG